jgi:hypothetical protein
MHRVAKVFCALDALEFTIVAIPAGLILLFGPLFAAFHFFCTQRPLAAAFVFGLWVLCAVGCVRDFRRDRFSWLSGSLALLWLIATLVLWCMG